MQKPGLYDSLRKTKAPFIDLHALLEVKGNKYRYALKLQTWHKKSEYLRIDKN